ncbi:MAG: hypothetical protein QG626_744, partial [Patescibacteria group bacterium]|nr:hypothetical protein [Patescibacteria group bacterium]
MAQKKAQALKKPLKKSSVPPKKKVAKGVVKKVLPKKAPAKLIPDKKSNPPSEEALNRMIERGMTRGFVTENE